MNRVFVTGDLHGEHDIHKLSGANWKEGKTLDKNDYLIIAGDFGLIFNNIPTESEKYWLRWLDERPWTTLFVDGNHENFDRLFNDDLFPEKDMFGSKARHISESIFYLQRGYVYTIADRTFFTMGGAPSIDKASRVSGESWWYQEEPSYIEWHYALIRAKQVGSVDYLITHDTLPGIYDKLHKQNLLSFKLKNSVSEGLWALDRHLQYKHAYSGHMHVDMTFPEYRWTILYNNIIELE